MNNQEKTILDNFLSKNKTTLTFTFEEKAQYLRRLGYEIRQVIRNEERHEHRHGSTFTLTHQQWTDWVAVKDEKEYNITETFEQLIKQQLLTGGTNK